MSVDQFAHSLFNLVTREGNTGLLFSKRKAITDRLLEEANPSPIRP